MHQIANPQIIVVDSGGDLLGVPLETDVVVIGGGIVGLAATALAAEAGYRVVVVVLGHGRLPTADTLWNHQWWQSGLLYVRSQGYDKAVKFKTHGLEVFSFLALPEPHEGGVFGFASTGEEAIADFWADVEMIRLRHRVEELASHAARRLVGPLYDKQMRYFSVPDTHFPEAMILSQLRERARAAGARTVELDPSRPATLVRTSRAHGGVLVEMNGDRGQRCQIEAGHIILAAGAGLLALLGQIGQPMQLATYRSPLLRCIGELRTPLFVNRTTDLAVVGHRDADNQRLRYLIVGDRSRTEVEPGTVRARSVTSGERKRLLAKVPAVLQGRDPDRLPIYGGLKTEIVDPNSGVPSATMQVRPLPDYPTVVFAVPGKATMGFTTARTALEVAGVLSDALGPIRPLPPLPRKGGGADAPLARMPEWEERIQQVFDARYDRAIQDAAVSE